MEMMAAKKLAADLPISLPRQGYEYRSVHWGRLPGAKIGMSSGNTWDNRVLHLYLRHCLRYVLREEGTALTKQNKQALFGFFSFSKSEEMKAILVGEVYHQGQKVGRVSIRLKQLFGESFGKLMLNKVTSGSYILSVKLACFQRWLVHDLKGKQLCPHSNRALAPTHEYW